MDKNTTCFQRHLKIPQTVIPSSCTHIVISNSSLSRRPRDTLSGPLSGWHWALGWHWAPSYTEKAASMSHVTPLLGNSLLLGSATSLHQPLVLEGQEDPQLSADSVFSPAAVLPAGHWPYCSSVSARSGHFGSWYVKENIRTLQFINMILFLLL